MDSIERTVRSEVVYCRERWDTIYPEVLPLAQAHFENDNPPGSPKHGKYDLDVDQLAELDASGAFYIFSARHIDGLLGYSTWTIMYDIECKGLLVAEQGPLWCNKPASGVQLYNYGLHSLRELGVRVVYPYHRLTGRSLRLGSFFTLCLGARAIKAGYELELQNA